MTITPASKKINWNEAHSGFWFADGTYVQLPGILTHIELAEKLGNMEGWKDREEVQILCESGSLGEGWVRLWDTGIVRVLTKGSGVWHINLQGRHEFVLARLKECMAWMGPDEARVVEVIVAIVEDNTDLDLVWIAAPARTALAWLLMGCPNKQNRRVKTGGYGTSSNAIRPTEEEVRQALRKAGIYERRD